MKNPALSGGRFTEIILASLEQSHEDPYQKDKLLYIFYKQVYSLLYGVSH